MTKKKSSFVYSVYGYLCNKNPSKSKPEVSIIRNRNDHKASIPASFILTSRNLRKQLIQSTESLFHDPFLSLSGM